MADLLYNFSQNANRGLLTNIGAGANQIVNQVRARKAEEAKMANYNGILKEFNTTHDPSLIPSLQQAYPEKFEGWKQGQASMGEAQTKALVNRNTGITSLIGSGDPTLQASGVEKMRDLSKAHGETTEQGQYWKNLADTAESGDIDKVRTILDIETGQSELGQKALTSGIALTTEKREQMKTDVEVAKTLDGMNITSPEQRDRIGSALAQMPSGMGDVLSQFLTVRSALDNGDMTLAELGKAEKDLRAEFDDYTKPYRTVIENVTSMEAMLQDPTGAVDFGVIRMFNKALDPNSVVRESEAAGTAAATGVLDRLSAKMENIKKGDLIGEDLRRDILEASKILQAGADENVSKQFNRLNETVKDFGYKDTRIWDKDDIEKYSNFSSFQAKAEETSEVDGFTEFILNKYPNEGDIVEGKSLEELKKEYSNTYKDFLGGSSGAATDFEGAEEL